MDIRKYLDAAAGFSHNHPILAVIIGCVLLYFMVRKTRLFFFVLFLGLLALGAFLTIMDAAGGGGSVKSRLLDKSSSQGDPP